MALARAVQLFVNILGVCVTAPIWLYLLYKLLEAAPATELMWFLYWVYVPVALVVHVAGVVARWALERDR